MVIILTKDMGRKTTIQIEESTRNVLRDLGKKNDSYDDIILRLVEKAERATTTEKKTMKPITQEIRN